MSAEWKGQRVPCGEQSANLLPAGIGNCGVPSVPCQPACDSQRLLWASKCGMPTWEIKAPAPDLQLESVGRRDCGIKTHRVYSERGGYVDSILERSLTTENLKGEWTCPFPLLNLMKLNLWVGKKKNSLRFIVLRIHWDRHLISARAKEGGNRWEELIILAKLFFEQQDDSWTSTKVFNDLLSLLHNKVNLSCVRSLNKEQVVFSLVYKQKF